MERINNSCSIHNGDCVEFLKELKTGSVDTIITDPPYQYLKHELDVAFPEKTVFKEFYRVLKKVKKD